MNNLGLLLLEMELLDEARPRIEESLRLREAALGPEHEEVATSLFNLARLQLAENDPGAASGSLSRCLAIREKTLGSEHPYVVSTMDLYGEVLRQLGENDRAIEIEQRALAIRDSAN